MPYMKKEATATSEELESIPFAPLKSESPKRSGAADSKWPCNKPHNRLARWFKPRKFGQTNNTHTETHTQEKQTRKHLTPLAKEESTGFPYKTKKTPCLVRASSVSHPCQELNVMTEDRLGRAVNRKGAVETNGLRLELDPPMNRDRRETYPQVN